ncbi:MAG: HIT domain-containing protein, partial [Patescibacteria group bacterium]
MNSELRQDIVSGDWIILAPGRAERPHEIFNQRLKRKQSPIKKCPFENPQTNGNREPILIYPNAKKWRLQVIENRYPAVQHKNVCGVLGKSGPYSIFPSIGYHDLVITRDHDKNFTHLSFEEAIMVFQAFHDRYLMLYNDDCLNYISIFHNWGSAAGASIYHPHYQILALPVTPPDVQHSFNGSLRYFKEHKTCVHCAMIKWEHKEKKRIIFENEGAIAFAPFVSRSPFEIRIFPKLHQPFFENSYDQQIEWVVEALQKTLRSLEKKLKDPDYNFFIHTAPVKNKKDYQHYHWHLEILPKASIRAGFEL